MALQLCSWFWGGAGGFSSFFRFSVGMEFLRSENHSFSIGWRVGESAQVLVKAVFDLLRQIAANVPRVWRRAAVSAGLLFCVL
jgi:hypothetical protein